MSVYAVEIDGRKGLAADLLDGYVKILFADGTCVIARPLATTDARSHYDPDEPRDEHGQWAASEGGGNKGSGGSGEPDEEADDAGTLPAKKKGGGEDNRDLEHRRAVIKVCKRVARQYGFPPDKIKYEDGGYSFKLSGKHQQAAAVIDVETGIITVFPGESSSAEDAGHALAHEIAHKVYESVDRAREREFNKMKAAGGFSALWTDGGDLKPEFHRKYPVHAEVARFSIRLKGDLETEDGVTPYSTEWWQAYAKGEASRHVAEHETFAEIGRVTHESRASHGNPWQSPEAKQVSPVWRAYFEAVQRAYKRVK